MCCDVSIKFKCEDVCISIGKIVAIVLYDLHALIVVHVLSFMTLCIKCISSIKNFSFKTFLLILKCHTFEKLVKDKKRLSSKKVSKEQHANNEFVL